ncbi:iron-sulfur cluster biosynthesis family protein [Oceanobacillus senegalensis]|uniref:iron-sulfur cluster biosynthesis family protein n=1 Tax=Oceanobacillus senegalensis TaxID=1936063 RepID=UPI000A3132EF|nr:iron-sulfur cluster biosynthesis family protein [Oceanobacillus senegalensis]
MKLMITPEGIEKLQELNIDNKTYLLLWYDVDDCGCGVNGVPTIRFTDKKLESHIDVVNESYPTLIHEQQQVFFNKELKLDVRNGNFRLTSPEEVLNPFIPAQSVCSVT